MERSGNKFEREWKDHFAKAEIKPREEVWTKIDSTLANRQIQRYRRKIFIYKLLAAASIVFALGIGYFNSGEFFRTDESRPDQLSKRAEAENETIRSGENISGDKTDPVLDEPALTSREDMEMINHESENAEREDRMDVVDQVERADELGIVPKRGGMERTEIADSRGRNVPNQAENLSDKLIYTGTTLPAGSIDIHRDPDDNRESTPTYLPYLSNRLNIESKIPSQNIENPGKKSDPYSDDWYAMYEETRRDEQEDRTKFWAGINFSSGVFDPNISYGNGQASLSDQTALFNGSADLIEEVPSFDNNISNFMRAARPEETTYEPEFSYAYGINVGYQISPKFIIRGGISYLSNHTSTTINSYIENSATNRKMPNQALYSVSIESAGVTSVNTSTEEFKLNNTYEFISMPVSLGYYLIDKKIQWMLTAGITTDFFLKNTISDPSDFLESKEIRAGSDSPYNNSYLNGTLGTMVNLSFAEHYRFSLEPSYRLGLSEFSKEDAAFTSRPSALFITVGISYIFK